MSLILAAKETIEQITGDPTGWGWPLKFIAPTGEEAEVVGLYTKHHMGMDTQGNRVNFKNAHCSCSEKFLVDKAYPVRNARGEVFMKNHTVVVTDVTGVTWQYRINENYPDETVGLIVFMLGDLE